MTNTKSWQHRMIPGWWDFDCPLIWPCPMTADSHPMIKRDGTTRCSTLWIKRKSYIIISPWCKIWNSTIMYNKQCLIIHGLRFERSDERPYQNSTDHLKNFANMIQRKHNVQTFVSENFISKELWVKRTLKSENFMFS